MKKHLTLFIILAAVGVVKAQNFILNDSIRNRSAMYFEQGAATAPAIRATTLRSDTIDLLHINIALNVTDFAGQTISGSGEVQFRCKMNGISQLYLDLLKMNIDSITQQKQKLNFIYATDSNILVINLLATLQQGDSSAVTVFYHGHPQCDVPTFGGLYFIKGYAYNIGVGPPYYPHSVGRAWHPCFDNFVERATYDYHITASDTNMALCNGILADTVHHGDSTITWHWRMDGLIPSYLANLAVGRYGVVHQTLHGINGAVPVQLASVPKDTTIMKNSFTHLANAFSIFESHYGAYPWNKVGYVMVPYSNVAMEHTTNITYPSVILSGNTVYENTYAHELAHHWFGDLVTIETAEDYWLKEGWAVFSEKLFYENVYGHARYLVEVANTHEEVLHYAHIFDGSYLPEYPIPQQYSYGQTVYNRGEDVAHTLRGYLGDSLLFHCLKNYLKDNAYTAKSSYDFRDYLSTCSGVDLTSFFDDWVFSGGFPHFSVDSFTVSKQSNGWYGVTVHVRQRLDNAPHYYTHVPLEITFMDSTMKSQTEPITVSGSCTIFNTMLPFKPVFVCSDLAEKISDAITENYDTIRHTGLYTYEYGKMNVVVTAITDSAFLRIEHNFIPPDPMKKPIPNLHLSQERYWRVDGIIPTGFSARATIFYNGTYPSSPTMNGGYLDSKLITNSEDSLVLMHRNSVSDDWQIEPDIILNIQGSAIDKVGVITINHLKKGEYALAIYQAGKIDSIIKTPPADSCQLVLAVKEAVPENENIIVYPNPASNNFTLEGMLNSDSHLDIFNLVGRNIYQSNLPKGIMRKDISTKGWATGIYLVRISDSGQQNVLTRKVIVQGRE